MNKIKVSMDSHIIPEGCDVGIDGFDVGCDDGTLEGWSISN